MSDDPGCTCPYGMASGGVIDKVRMPPSMARLSTTKDCPVHDSCQHYTKANRAARPSWSMPWCPIHEGRNCPS